MCNEKKETLMTVSFRVGVTICLMAIQYGWVDAQDAVDSQAPVIARSALRVDLPVTLDPPQTSSEEDRLDLEKGPLADWIWRQKAARDGERVTFTKKITMESTRAAQLIATCDNHFSLFVNGKPVAKGDDWSVGVRADIQPHLKVGVNELKAVCINEGTGLGAFICKIALQGPDDNIRYVVTDEGWK